MRLLKHCVAHLLHRKVSHSAQFISRIEGSQTLEYNKIGKYTLWHKNSILYTTYSSNNTTISYLFRLQKYSVNPFFFNIINLRIYCFFGVFFHTAWKSQKPFPEACVPVSRLWVSRLSETLNSPGPARGEILALLNIDYRLI